MTIHSQDYDFNSNAAFPGRSLSLVILAGILHSVFTYTHYIIGSEIFRTIFDVALIATDIYVLFAFKNYLHSAYAAKASALTLRLIILTLIATALIAVFYIVDYLHKHDTEHANSFLFIALAIIGISLMVLLVMSANAYYRLGKAIELLDNAPPLLYATAVFFRLMPLIFVIHIVVRAAMQLYHRHYPTPSPHVASIAFNIVISTCYMLPVLLLTLLFYNISKQDRQAEIL